MNERDITLSIDLDSKDVISSAEELQEVIKGIFSSQNGTESPALMSLSATMKKTVIQAQELQAELTKVGSTQIKTEEFETLENKFNELARTLGTERRELESILAKGFSETGDVYQAQLKKVEELRAKLHQVRGEMDSMRSSGTAFISGTETQQYAELEQKLDNVNDKLRQQIVKHQAIINKQRESNAEAKQTPKHVNNTNKALKGVQKGFRTILKYAFGIRSVYFLVNKIRRAIKEGYENLFTYNTDLKKQIDDIKGQCKTIKNAFATAFEPLVTVAIPYVQRLLDWIIKLFDTIAQFTAAARGQKTYTKALKQMGDTAEKAGAQAKGSLGSFDKLNNITSQSGGDSTAKMFEETAINEKLLTTLDKIKKGLRDIANSPEVKKFADSFVEMMNKVVGATRRVGANVGKGIVGGVQQFFDENGDRIKLDIGKIFEIKERTFTQVGNFADALGEISDVIGSESGQGLIASLIKLQYTVGMVFGKIGALIQESGIYTFTQPIIDNVDKIKESMTTAFDATRDAINNVSTSLEEFGDTITQAYEENIKPAVENITSIFSDAFGLILDIVTPLYSWISESLGEALAKLIEKAGPILSEIMGIVKELSVIIKWLWDTILAPFFTWLKDTFLPIIKSKIDAYSTQIKSIITILGNIIKTILALVRTVFGSIADIITGKPLHALERFKNFFSDTWESIKESLGSAWEYIKSIFNQFTDLFGAVGDVFGKIGDKVKGFFDWNWGGGKSATVNVPGYASGQVIPPSMSAHLAVLGDNKRETEVVSPLSTIRQAVTEAMEGMGGGAGQPQQINLYLDGREFMKVMVDRNREYKKQNGGTSAFA